MKLSLGHMLGALSVAIVLAACSNESTVGPTGSPLAGLNESGSGDTANVSHTPTGSGPGYFRGTVLGPSEPGAGNDSLSTAPRIAGVVITIYEMNPTAPDGVGAAKGNVTTGADGLFTLPTLPAGDYVVTFVPPSSAGLHGAYVTGPLRQNSSEFPWWVVLAKK